MAQAATLAGAIDLGFAVFHLGFWRLFGWPARLESSGRLNAAITPTMNIMLIYVFLAAGIGMIVAAPAWLAWGGAGFWALRALLQPLQFGLRHWVSVALFALMVLGAVLHALAA